MESVRNRQCRLAANVNNLSRASTNVCACGRPDLVWAHGTESSQRSEGFTHLSDRLFFCGHVINALVAVMRRPEFVSRFLILVGIVLAIGVPILFWSRTPLIHVSMAEAGGWSPDIFKAEVGKPLELQLTSDDVVHGFAVGQMEMEGVDVLPGK